MRVGPDSLKTLLNGVSVQAVLAELDSDPQKISDIAHFPYAVRQQL